MFNCRKYLINHFLHWKNKIKQSDKWWNPPNPELFYTQNHVYQKLSASLKP